MPLNPSAEDREMVRGLFKEYKRRHPLISVYKLAQVAKKENPKIKYSVESLAGVMRAVRDEVFSEGIENEKREFEIPETDYKEYIPHPLRNKVIGVLNDIHIPYHDPKALEIALKHLKYRGVDCILLNGDIADCYSISRWIKDPKNRNLKREYDLTRAFLAELRAKFPKVDIVFKLGNHEERHQHYIWQNAYELWQVEQLTLPELLKCRDLRIEVVEDKRIIQAGRLNILHGHEIRMGGGVNVARTALLKSFGNVMVGHFHKTQTANVPAIDGKVKGAWAVGCLCGLHPDYMVLSDWNAGFAVVEVDTDGYFSVDNLTIINGAVK